MLVVKCSRNTAAYYICRVYFPNCDLYILYNTYSCNIKHYGVTLNRYFPPSNNNTMIVLFLEHTFTSCGALFSNIYIRGIPIF